MALIAALSGERDLERRLDGLLQSRHSVVHGHSWGGLQRLVRERPVAGAILELGAVRPAPSREGALWGFRSLFPHLGIVLLVRSSPDPVTLFRLGRAGIRNLILLRVDRVEGELERALARASDGSATSLVSRFLSPYLPRRELRVAFLAMDSVHERWTAERLAEQVGLTRPHLSERLKEVGLPSLGHFLLWTRLFHAAHWLEEPGRTGESVGRQLEYSSGAAFRRALKRYTDATPSEVRERGGLRWVFRRFLQTVELQGTGAGGKGRGLMGPPGGRPAPSGRSR